MWNAPLRSPRAPTSHYTPASLTEPRQASDAAAGVNVPEKEFKEGSSLHSLVYCLSICLLASRVRTSCLLGTSGREWKRSAHAKYKEAAVSISGKRGP